MAISGSVALMADTIHNFSDALTAIPLGLAFWLSRRARNRRYTYGYGRAEDIAGVIIVVMIAFSAAVAIYQSILKIINPQPLSNLGWVAAAAIIGFFGNELVAVFRIRIGKEIGSAALIADGYHARTDGLTSLAVLAGTIGVWLGHRLYGEMHITVNCQLSTLQSHFIAEEVRHSLFHKLPALVEVVVHVDPCECDEAVDYHPTKRHVFLPAAD